MGGIPWYLEDLDPDVYLDESLWLTLDFETTNEEKGSALVQSNRVVLAALAISDLEVRQYDFDPDPVPVAADRERLYGPLKNACRDAKILVAHNAKFELQWLRRLRIDTSHLLVLDPMIAEYVIAGNRRWPLDLDSVARRYGIGSKDPVISALMSGGVCPSLMPRKRLEDRVCSDVEMTRTLARLQMRRLKESGLLAAFFTRCIITPVLANMEFEGMTLDRDRVLEEYGKTQRAKASQERVLADLAGGINLGSPKQLAEFLYGPVPEAERKPTKTKSKVPPVTKTLGFKPKLRRDGTQDRSTAAEVLENLKAETKEQRAFLKARREWGKLNARITKSLEFYKHICDERNGLFFGQFNQAVTQTHRLSASGRRVTFSDGYEGGAQFQNQPREYKKLFSVSRGAMGRGNSTDVSDYVLVETDGSGLEFRVAAERGRDSRAIADIRSGADVHRFTASVMCKKPEAEVTKEERQDAKPETFKPLYGGEYGTPDQMRYYQAFREKYPDITRTQEAWATEVLRTKQLRTASGLILYWPHAKPDRRDGRLDGGSRRQVYNYPIQGFATADIIPIALAFVAAGVAANGIRARLLNTVHDSIVAEVHKDDVEEYLAVAEDAFLGRTYDYLERVYGIDFTVPLGIGITVGTHWGQGEERKISYDKEAAMKKMGWSYPAENRIPY